MGAGTEVYGSMYTYIHVCRLLDQQKRTNSRAFLRTFSSLTHVYKLKINDCIISIPFSLKQYSPNPLNECLDLSYLLSAPIIM